MDAVNILNCSFYNKKFKKLFSNVYLAIYKTLFLIFSTWGGGRGAASVKGLAKWQMNDV